MSDGDGDGDDDGGGDYGGGCGGGDGGTRDRTDTRWSCWAMPGCGCSRCAEFAIDWRRRTSVED